MFGFTTTTSKSQCTLCSLHFSGTRPIRTRPVTTTETAAMKVTGEETWRNRIFVYKDNNSTTVMYFKKRATFINKSFYTENCRLQSVLHSLLLPIKDQFCSFLIILQLKKKNKSPFYDFFNDFFFLNICFNWTCFYCTVYKLWKYTVFCTVLTPVLVQDYLKSKINKSLSLIEMFLFVCLSALNHPSPDAISWLLCRCSGFTFW